MAIRLRFLAPPADIAHRADEVFGGQLKPRRAGQAVVLNHVLRSECRSECAADRSGAAVFS